MCVCTPCTSASAALLPLCPSTNFHTCLPHFPPPTPAQYAVLAYFFASKMNRLIILMGPIASVLSGVWVGVAVDWGIRQSVLLLHWSSSGAPAATGAKQNGSAASAEAEAKKSGKKGEKAKKGRNVPAVGLTDNLKMISDDVSAVSFGGGRSGRKGRGREASTGTVTFGLTGSPMLGIWTGHSPVSLARLKQAGLGCNPRTPRLCSGHQR